MKRVCILLYMAMSTGLLAQTPPADWILEKVDENMYSETKKSVADMIINGRRGRRTV